jgi:hypothetical protein
MATQLPSLLALPPTAVSPFRLGGTWHTLQHSDPVLKEGVPKVIASGWWGMAKEPENAISNFATGARGFSATGCSAFLCAFAPLR